MSNRSKPPFVKLPCSIRSRLCELTPYEFMVWTDYYTRGSKDAGIAYPKNETVCADTGLYRDTVSKAIGGLLKKGWLLSRGFLRLANGTLTGVRRYQAVIPDVVSEPLTARNRRRLTTDDGLNQHTDAGFYQHADAGFGPTQKQNPVEVEPAEEPSPYPLPEGGDCAQQSESDCFALDDDSGEPFEEPRDYSIYVDIWSHDSPTDMPALERLADYQIEKLRQLERARNFERDFEQAVRLAAITPKLNGVDGAAVDFDWFLDEGNVQRLFDGHYGVTMADYWNHAAANVGEEIPF